MTIKYAAFYSADPQDTGMILGFGASEDAALQDALSESDMAGLGVSADDLTIVTCDESLDEGHPSSFVLRNGHAHDIR